jgi:hypothetical protein
MDTEQRLKSLIGDLVVQLAVAQTKIEELEKQIASQKDIGTGTTEG